jgi:PAS domain S-box-containing protein
MNHEDKTATQLTEKLNSLRRRMAELEAQASQNTQINEELLLFKSIVEASQEAIAISDPEGRLLYINPAHKKLFGRSLEEAKELNYRDYYPPESVEVLNRELAPALERGESWEGEMEVFHASGRLHARHHPEQTPETTPPGVHRTQSKDLRRLAPGDERLQIEHRRVCFDQ